MPSFSKLALPTSSANLPLEQARMDAIRRCGGKLWDRRVPAYVLATLLTDLRYAESLDELEAIENEAVGWLEGTSDYSSPTRSRPCSSR
jgi:hypothetical protein